MSCFLILPLFSSLPGTCVETLAANLFSVHTLLSLLVSELDSSLSGSTQYKYNRNCYRVPSLEC